MNPCSHAILAIVQSASLTEEELGLWREVAEHIPRALCESLCDTLRESPDMVRAMTESLAQKKKAILAGDVAAWEEALRADEKVLRMLEK